MGRETFLGLTRKQFDILLLLASAPETVVFRRDLIAAVRADEWAISTRTVDTHVSALRAKLGEGWITTVRGVGYRLEDTSRATPPPGRTGPGKCAHGTGSWEHDSGPPGVTPRVGGYFSPSGGAPSGGV